MRIPVFLMLLISLRTVGQHSTLKDIQLLQTTTISTPHFTSPNNRKPIVPKHNSAIAKYNPVMLFFKGSMLFYQYIVSPQLSAGCLYQRSCSNYAKEAIHTAGLFRGILMSADRLTRCNRSCLSEMYQFYFDANGKAVDEPCIHFEE